MITINSFRQFICEPVQGSVTINLEQLFNSYAIQVGVQGVEGTIVEFNEDSTEKNEFILQKDKQLEFYDTQIKVIKIPAETFYDTVYINVILKDIQ